MSKLIKNTGLAAALGCAAIMTSFQVAAESENAGWFIGGGVYYSGLDDTFDDVDDIGDVFEIDLDDNSTAFNLAGGYRINHWLAVDAGYWDLGNYSSDFDEDFGREKVDATAWTVGGMASVPLWIMDFYARGGAAFWDFDGRGAADSDGTDPYYGLGAAFNVGRSLDIYAEWIRFDLDTEVDTFGLGVRWTF
ncbi:MAG: outer membrane beta-barrel protein [Halioglobus sp.]